MITSFSVEHFKAISSCELSNLKRINLFGGKNNTGKSTVIEALFFFLDRQNPQSFMRMHNWRGGMPTSMTSFDIFAPIFHNYDMSKPVKISVKEGADLEKLTLHSVEQNNTTIKINPKDISTLSGTNTKSLEHNQVEIAVDFSSPTKGKLSEQKIIHTIHDEENMDVKINKQTPIKSAIFLSSRSPINPNENAIRFGELVKKTKKI
ncbi:AAA family ATPase [Sporosarcina sp. GW1-11]|uniref:AAA family ATPase n=1 Tax=Sporosarcina sp. GW1-11 TaxID=2899126 RepID=UPI00294DDB1C|nr:AAA family ATPase [Sporosarcina sp. GW1-11]MDV6378437.1 AAA family ATPase [Sporosarcina sp. GW1-11]